MKRAGLLFLAVVFLIAMFPAATLAATPATQSDMLVYAKEPVFMRAGPGAEYESIVELQMGEAVIWQGVNGKWTAVRRNGETGYVFGQYLTDPAHALGDLYTATSNTTVYTSRSTKSKRLGKLKKGELVVWYNSTNAWSGVYWGDGIGYVRSKYLKALSKSSSGYGTGLNAIDLLDRSNYFAKKNADIFIEYYLTATQTLAIRVARNADRAKLEKEVAEILGKDIPFYIVLSSLPTGYNAAKIAKTMDEITAKYEGLTAAQKEQLQLSSWGYSPSFDHFRVGLVVCDQAATANFKQWIGDIPNVEFVQENISLLK